VPASDTFWVTELPTQLQVVLAIRLVALPEELTLEEKHAAMNRVRDSQDQVISEIQGELAVEGQSARPGWLAGIILPAVVAFEAQEEGTYTVERPWTRPSIQSRSTWSAAFPARDSSS
jgi:hypothetical protein